MAICGSYNSGTAGRPAGKAMVAVLGIAGTTPPRRVAGLQRSMKHRPFVSDTRHPEFAGALTNGLSLGSNPKWTPSEFCHEALQVTDYRNCSYRTSVMPTRYPAGCEATLILACDPRTWRNGQDQIGRSVVFGKTRRKRGTTVFPHPREGNVLTDLHDSRA